MGHVVEVPLAYGELTCLENLRLAARLRGVDPALADTALTEFRLTPYAVRRTRHLSLGNRQRLGLAAALMHDPGIVVLDEPTTALDPAGVLILRDRLLSMARSGAAVLVSSHHLDEVARIADRVVLMNDGRLIGTLDTTEPDLERAFFARIHADDLSRGRYG